MNIVKTIFPVDFTIPQPLTVKTAIPVDIIYGIVFFWINRMVQRERTAKEGPSAKPKYKRGRVAKIALTMHFSFVASGVILVSF